MNNRIIKFRGLIYNRWVYGTPVFDSFDPQKVSMISYAHHKGDSYTWDDVEHQSICQFTGLKDISGREIYEGDIVSYDNRDGYAEVRWDEEDGSYYLTGNNLSWLDVFQDKRRWYKCSVVGNIFETPELIDNK